MSDSWSARFNEEEVLTIAKIIAKSLCKEASWESGAYIHVTYVSGKGFVAKNVTDKIKDKVGHE